MEFILGVFTADVASGLFHWYEDNYLEYCTTVPILKDIAIHNEMHHYFPRMMLAESVLSNASITVLLSSIILGIVFFIRPDLFAKYPVFLLTVFVGGSLANVLHRYSHSRPCEMPKWICALQKVGILCSHDHHRGHHVRPRIRYCTITPITNHLLDAIHIWDILELVIYMTTGIRPRLKPAYDDYSCIHETLHKISAGRECPPRPTKEDKERLHAILASTFKCNQTGQRSKACEKQGGGYRQIRPPNYVDPPMDISDHNPVT